MLMGVPPTLPEDNNMHPTYLGWQVDWPVFVKVPFSADNREWQKQDHFNWLNRNISEAAVSQLYNSGFLYHNKELEKQTKVGDRLEEMGSEELYSLVTLLNSQVKARTNSTAEFTSKKCKQSKVDMKQRGMIRSFLRDNRWIEDYFYETRDKILG
jgi:hypothetical protein